MSSGMNNNATASSSTETKMPPRQQRTTSIYFKSKNGERTGAKRVYSETNTNEKTWRYIPFEPPIQEEKENVKEDEKDARIKELENQLKESRQRINDLEDLVCTEKCCKIGFKSDYEDMVETSYKIIFKIQTYMKQFNEVLTDLKERQTELARNQYRMECELARLQGKTITPTRSTLGDIMEDFHQRMKTTSLNPKL